MKKNFIKKLAFVMASALVVSGTAPAAQAGAALKDVKLNKTSKNLYLNADNQTSTSNKFNFDYKNLGKKADYTVKWSVEDSSVVKLAKGGVVTAKKVGTTSVYCKITKKSTGKSVTLEATVNVKANAASVAITNVPENNTMLVGVANDFNRTMKSVEGKKATDKTAWEIVGENTAGASVDSKGVVTATKTGEFTLKASTYQSKATKATPTATNEVTIKVVTDTVEAKQTTLNKFDVTFLSDVSKTVTKENLELYRVVNTSEVKEVVKDITFNTDGTVATVELFNTLGNDTKYIVKVKDMTDRDFTATIGDVTDMAITSTTAVFGGPAAVKVALYNAQGVDITTADLLARVDLSLVDTTTNAYLDSANKEITIFNEGDKVPVKATFHTWKYDDAGTETIIERTAVITGVNASSVTVGSEAEYDIIKTTDGESWWSTTNKLAAEDGDRTLLVRFKKSDGSYENATFANGYTFKSSNENTLMINEFTGALYPTKAGSAQVLVYKDNKVITAVPIEIVAKRSLTTFALNNPDVTVSNSANIGTNDTVTVGYTAKDNLGEDIAVTVEVEGLANVGNNGNSLTFDGSTFANGTYSYRITAKDANNVTRTQVFRLAVQAPSATTPAYYRVVLNTNNVDLAIDSNTNVDNKNVTVTLFGYANNGVANYVATGAEFSYVISKDGTTVQSGTFTDADANNGAVTFDTIDVAGGFYTKVATGTYKVVVTDVTANKVVNQQYFTITNNQKSAVTVNPKAIKSSVSGTAIEAGLSEADVTALINNCFVVTLNGDIITSTNDNVVSNGFYGLKATVRGNSCFVESVKYKESINGTYVEHTINIGQTIAINQ